MNKRVFEVRKELNLSQDTFGEKLGLTKSGVSKIERGERGLTDTMFKLICSTYNVNPEWLEFGTGNMFKDDFIDEFAYYCAKFGAEEDEFKKTYILELLKLYDSLTDEQWQAYKKNIKTVSSSIKGL